MSRGVCIEENCTRLASYGPPKSNIRIYCKNHKTEQMENTTNPLCIKCDTQATFGTFECRKITCKKHKLQSMIHISKKNYKDESNHQI